VVPRERDRTLHDSGEHAEAIQSAKGWIASRIQEAICLVAFSSETGIHFSGKCLLFGRIFFGKPASTFPENASSE
jgi:hypothetical protein